MPQITSARGPPECWSAAIRALSWPVVARNTLTLTPGWSFSKPFSTAVTVSWVTEVYRVSWVGGLLAEPTMGLAEEADPQAVMAAASRNGTAVAQAREILIAGSATDAGEPGP